MYRRIPLLEITLLALSLFLLIYTCGCGDIFVDDGGLGEYICDHLTEEEADILAAVQGMLEVVGIDYVLPCVIVVRDPLYLGFSWPDLVIEGFPPAQNEAEGYDALIYNDEIYIKRFGSTGSIDAFEELLLKMVLAANGYPQDMWRDVKGAE